MNRRRQNFREFFRAETREQLRPAVHRARHRDGVDPVSAASVVMPLLLRNSTESFAGAQPLALSP